MIDDALLYLITQEMLICEGFLRSHFDRVLTVGVANLVTAGFMVRTSVVRHWYIVTVIWDSKGWVPRDLNKKRKK